MTALFMIRKTRGTKVPTSRCLLASLDAHCFRCAARNSDRSKPTHRACTHKPIQSSRHSVVAPPLATCSVLLYALSTTALAVSRNLLLCHAALEPPSFESGIPQTRTMSYDVQDIISRPLTLAVEIDKLKKLALQYPSTWVGVALIVDFSHSVHIVAPLTCR